MKKFLLLTVAALGIFVACEKDEFEALDEAFALEVARLDAADDVLQGNIDDLKAAFDAFVIAINEKIDNAVAALEAADDAIEAFFNAEIADLHEKLDKAVESLTASINDNTDLIKETCKELRKKIAEESVARAAGDLAIANELADQVEKLEKQDSIAASHINRNLGHIFSLGSAISRESAARVAADADLQSQINTVSSTLSSEIARVDAAAQLASLALLAEQQAREAADTGLGNQISGNDGDIATLQSNLADAVAATTALSARVSATEAFASRIATLESGLAAANLAIAAQGETDGTHASTLQTIQTSVTNLRTSLETFATNGDTTLRNAINVEIARIDLALTGVIAQANSNDVAIRGLQTNLGNLRTTVNAIDFIDATELQTALDALQATLEAHVGDNAFDASSLTASITALEGRVSAVEAFGGQITALETRIAALEGLDVVIGSELVTSIGSLRTELQAYADANGPADDDSALQTAIDALTARIVTLEARPAGSGSGSAITWEPYANQLDSYTQNGLLEGATVTRPVTVTEGSPSDVLGQETVTITYDGFATIEEAQAVHTAPGTYQIDRATRTVVADGVRSIIYTATANNEVIGTYTATSTIAGSDDTVNVDVPYTIAADATDPGFQISDPVQTRGGERSNLRDVTPAVSTKFLVDGSETPHASLEAARLAIPFGTSANISEHTTYNQIVDISAIETLYIYSVAGQPDGTETDGQEDWRETTAAQTGVASGTRVDAGTGSSYTSTAVNPNRPDTWTVTSQYGGGVTQGASTYEVIVSTATAASNVQSVTQTYDIRRMDTTAASGNVETYAVLDADDDLTDAFVHGSTREVQLVGESTDEVVVTAGLTREVANPAYVPAPAGVLGDTNADGVVDYTDAAASGFTVDAVEGALGGYRITYSAATGLGNVLVSTGSITQFLRTFDTITVALATEYAQAQALAAYVAQL